MLSSGTTCMLTVQAEQGTPESKHVCNTQYDLVTRKVTVQVPRYMRHFLLWVTAANMQLKLICCRKTLALTATHILSCV